MINTELREVTPDAEAPPIPDRCSDLDAFIADVTARYDVTGIYLFGSRGGGVREPSNTSDWDILVFMDERIKAGELVNDETLQRHFGESLDLFAMPSPGCWYYPDWTMREGSRGWFPESHPEIEANLQCVWEPTNASNC